MADDSKPDSTFLFCKENGEAMRFFLRPSATKARLRPLIEERGGMVSSKLHGNQEWIKLAADGEKISSDDYYTVQYIDDCIAANQLLPMDKYKFHQQQPRPPSPTNSVMTNISIRGRSKYDSSEDAAIIAFIAKHTECSYSGNQIWKKMEFLKITDHSWQSMRDRFHKKLVHKLPNYIKSQQEKAEINLTSDTDGSEDEEANATTSAESHKGADLNTPSKDQRKGTATNTGLGDSKSPLTSPNTEINRSENVLEVSSGSESDFDEYLFQVAEKSTPKKLGRSLVKSARSSDSHGDRRCERRERPHRARRDASNETGDLSKLNGHLGTDAADDTTEDDLPSSKRRRKDHSVTSNTDDLMAGSLTESESQTSDFPTSDSEFEEGVNKVVSFVKEAMDDYSVPAKTVVQLLYIHSGDFDSVLKHLQTGRYPEGIPYWTKEDDKKLNSSNPKDIQELCGMYGQEAVMKRQAFFN
ncbi:telomeric repeat-binding factor 2-interacting protein 1-like isoform X2 [Acanthaster planci]|nr:telomeric repeat-binding factor 2-interacting protein 1-like isoform X2 [Acanthaster planci]